MDEGVLVAAEKSRKYPTCMHTVMAVLRIYLTNVTRMISQILARCAKEFAFCHVWLGLGKWVNTGFLLTFDNPYLQPNKIIAYLTFHKWLVSICNIHNDIWLVQTKTSHWGKVSYAIILLGWRYILFHKMIKSCRQ